jgi:hypothetical protein
MRTVILLGALAIAASNNSSYLVNADKGVVEFYAVTLIVVIVMDVVEYFKRVTK